MVTGTRNNDSTVCSSLLHMNHWAGHQRKAIESYTTKPNLHEHPQHKLKPQPYKGTTGFYSRVPFTGTTGSYIGFASEGQVPNGAAAFC